MPGNEHGDRVHNFFAQDNSSQGQHQSHVAEENWPGLNNNFWVGSQRQIDALNSNSKNYSQQNSDVDRGPASYPVHATPGFNFSQPNPRPDFSRSQSLSEQQHSNGFIYGNQFYQARQNEANFLAVDTDSDHRHLVASRGHEQQAKASDRLETPVPPVSFDLFGGQQQMSHQQASMLQAFQRQQSGLNDMQQLQQQLMIRKMQELQRQQQVRQLDMRPQNLINSAPNSDVLQYPLTAEPGPNWLSRGSSAMSSGLVFPPNVGQTQHLMDSMPQQVDHQSLYGVPVSSSRGLPVNQYSRMMTDRSSMPQMTTSSNSRHSNQHNFLSDGQEGTSISRQTFQNENVGHSSSSQPLNTVMMDMGSLQPVNAMQKNAPQLEFLGRQEPATTRLGTPHERSTREVSSSQNEAALDPTEEKILFGSDDNIWSAFGKSPDISGETGNLFDNGGLSNGFTSLQSGSWSALMQSAVAETSSSDMGPAEEWSGLVFHNTDDSSANQPPSMHNDIVKPASLHDDNMRNPSALGSRSIPSPDNVNTHNVMGLPQFGDRFQNESGERVLNGASQRFGQSLNGASQWPSRSPLHKSVAEGSLIYGNDSHDSLHAERNAKTISSTWAPGQSGTRQQPNGWNNLEAVSPAGDRVLNIHEVEKLPQSSQNNQVKVMQGEAVPGSSLWNSSSVSGSAIEFASMRSTVGNHLANKGVSSLSNNSASAANSCNASPFVQNNYLVNQWKNADPAAKLKGGESLGRMLDQVDVHNQCLDPLNSIVKDDARKHDMENSAMNENSSDSHHSNLSQHTSGGFRVSGLVDASDSKSQLFGKQKPTNQLARKAPPKFQYHPMGNLDEDAQRSHGLKQPTQVQAMSLQNSHFGQSNFFGQVQRDSMVTEKGELQKDNNDPADERSRDSSPGYVPNMSAPFSRAPTKASAPGQNMLELLHKVDQSRDHGGVMHSSSSECNVSSHPSDAEYVAGSVGRHQHSQSSLSQGFGLQLGPPSSSSQNAQSMVNSLNTSRPKMGEKSTLMVPPSSVHSLRLPNEESQNESENESTAGPEPNRNGNPVFKARGNYHPAFGSDNPYGRSQLQNKQLTRLSGKMAMNQHIDSSFSSNASQPMQKGSPQNFVPDASRNIQKDNLASPVQQSGPYDVHERGSAATASARDQMRSSQHFGISRPGGSSQTPHNIWTNVPQSHHTLTPQYANGQRRFSEPTQPNIVESSSQHDLGVSKGGNISSKSHAFHASSPDIIDGEERSLKERSGQLLPSANMDSGPKMEESQGKASSIHDLDDSPVNSASAQKDIEAFGRSLKPNMFSNKNIALLNQMRVVKDVETNSGIRFSKRMEGPENDHQVNLTAAQKNEDNFGDPFGSSTGVTSEDSTMINLPTPSAILQKSTPHENVSTQDILADASQRKMSTDTTTYVRDENHQVSPQMAPSWFSQYGSFKNGQILNNAHKMTSFRSGDPPFALGKSSTDLDAHNSEQKSAASSIDSCRVGTTLLNSASTSVTNSHLFSPQSLQLNVTDQHEVILRSKKRKIDTSEHHPWCKQISDGSHNISALSVAEADWNKAANRLTEKVDDDVEFMEDGSPVLRSKRRLILTTQLMQQLFCPPPANILSIDASSEAESITYSLSRVVLGDTCSSVSRSSGLSVPCDIVDKHPLKGKLTDDPRFTEIIEELLGKAKKLESGFLSLEKSASILDLRVEYQDLEKFSIINRFAKFHGRGQNDNVETASNDASSATQRPCAQRYVTAVPMPRCLPDRVQCLSL